MTCTHWKLVSYIHKYMRITHCSVAFGILQRHTPGHLQAQATKAEPPTPKRVQIRDDTVSPSSPVHHQRTTTSSSRRHRTQCFCSAPDPTLSTLPQESRASASAPSPRPPCTAPSFASRMSLASSPPSSSSSASASPSQMYGPRAPPAAPSCRATFRCRPSRLCGRLHAH